MITETAFLPGFKFLNRSYFNKPLKGILRRKENSSQTTKELLSHLFDHGLPLELLTHTDSKRRARIFSPLHTFMSYLYQILVKGSCREAVQFLSNHLVTHQLPPPSQANTSNYCRARQLLDLNTLEQISASIISRLSPPQESRILLIDGTSLSMPDTSSNQEEYPQSLSQAAGIGFPLLKMVALYDLKASALVSYELGNKHDHEVTLARKLYQPLKKGDLLIADRAYCSYRDMDMLEQKGVRYIIRNSRYKHEVDSGFNEGEILLKKPRFNKNQTGFDECCSESLNLRLIQTESYTMKGFKSERFLLLTNAPSESFDRALICKLYRSRWRIEMCFGSMKTQMGMDILKSKTVDMIKKEIKMHQIAYNLIYLNITKKHELPFNASFKAVCTRLTQFVSYLYLSVLPDKRTIQKLLSSIAKDILYERPDRYEPRVRKRRAKCIQLMTKPRWQYAWGEVIDSSY